MTFTNTELRALEKAIKKDIYGCESLISVQRVKALISRLDAAEEALGYFSDHLRVTTGWHPMSLLARSLEKWEKRCGKL